MDILLLHEEGAEMIAAHLLIHSASVKAPTGFDRDRNPTYGEASSVKCRIVPKNGRTMGQTGEQPDDHYLMLANSEITMGQTVTWEGKDFTVRKAWPCYALDGQKPDHWKAELV